MIEQNILKAQRDASRKECMRLVQAAHGASVHYTAHCAGDERVRATRIAHRLADLEQFLRSGGTVAATAET